MSPEIGGKICLLYRLDASVMGDFLRHEHIKSFYHVLNLFYMHLYNITLNFPCECLFASRYFNHKETPRYCFACRIAVSEYSIRFMSAMLCLFLNDLIIVASLAFGCGTKYNGYFFKEELGKHH